MDNELLKQTYDAVRRLEDKIEIMSERVIKLEALRYSRDKSEAQFESRIITLETKMENLFQLRWKAAGAVAAIAILGSQAVNKLLMLII